MPKKIKILLHFFISLTVAGFFILLIFKRFNLVEFKNSLAQTDFGYFVPTIIFFLLSFVARSEKWRIQVKNVNCRLCAKASYLAMMIHYFINLFTPKLGGIARCSYTKQAAGVNIGKCLGTYVSEVIFDLLFLLLALLLSLFFTYRKITDILSVFFSDLKNNYLQDEKILIAFVVFATVLLLIIIRLRKKLKNFLTKKLNLFLSAVQKTFRLKGFGYFVLWNLALWIMLLMMNFSLYRAITGNFGNFEIILTITIFTYFGWLMPSPGGIGSVQYFVLQAFLLWQLPETQAIAYGILSNSITFLSISIWTILLYSSDLSTKFFRCDRA